MIKFFGPIEVDGEQVFVAREKADTFCSKCPFASKNNMDVVQCPRVAPDVGYKILLCMHLGYKHIDDTEPCIFVSDTPENRVWLITENDDE